MDSGRSGSTRQARAQRARASSAPRCGRALLLLAALAALAGLLAAVLLLAGRRGAPIAIAPEKGGGGLGGAGAPGARDLIEPAAPRAAEPAESIAADPRRFDERAGRGTIRGTLETVGAAHPREWTLALAPARALIGAERAESRTLAFSAGETEFEVGDLPLGGYDVRAIAAGLDGTAVPVLLQRTSRESYVVLELAPAGFVEGSVEERGRGGVDGLAVHLVPEAGGVPLAAETDGRGWYTFPSVVGGRYRLFVGAVEAPLAPALALEFAPPSLCVPPIVLEPLGEVSITVLDARGIAPVGAVVRGTCNRGGGASATVDAFGVALARHLPAGRWRFRVQDELLGSGFTALDLGSGERASARIDLEAP